MELWKSSVPDCLSSPHSGQVFPEEFLANTGLTVNELRSSEDSFVSEIVKPASDAGIPLLSMNISRAFIDINRDKIEIDESMYYDLPQPSASLGSRRCRVGLGVIPRIVSQNRNIYDGLISYNEAMARIKNVYDPYHKRLKQLVDKCQKKFGCCLLVDCHSMPSQICNIMTEESRLNSASARCLTRAARRKSMILSAGSCRIAVTASNITVRTPADS